MVGISCNCQEEVCDDVVKVVKVRKGNDRSDVPCHRL